MLEQAVRFIGEGKFPQAKELLTGLLQGDQNNATYWIWMSAAMETQKERLYCLQMAYKMDPNNTAAQRGLVLMGALPPDETLTPFPMNHPRPWESKIKLADEKPELTGFQRVTSNPFFKLAVIGIVFIGVVGGAIFGLGALISSGQKAVDTGPTATSRPTVTPVVNPNAGPTVNSTIVPLSDLLVNGTYTPTAIYAMTPHGDVALDAYHGALRAYSQERWGEVANMMAQIATSQPGSVDTIYFIAEAKRLGGQYDEALDYYKEAIKINPKFAPIYLGQALANLGINPQKSVIVDLNKAIELDPRYAEAYMERGLYSMKRNDLAAAKTDLTEAASLNPDSPLIQVNLARVLLTLGDNELALEAAKKAQELDVTMLDAYLVLGMAYRANDQIDNAVDVLDTYTRYSPTNPEAFTVLASAYFKRGDYDNALKNIDQALLLDKRSAEEYRWRGEIYLALGETTKALSDFRQSYRTNVTFDAGIGIARAMLAEESFRDAYEMIVTLEKLLKTDDQKGLFFYYRALSLEGLNEQIAASRAWNDLLKLPEEATTEQMRQDAKDHIVALQSATPPLPSPTITKTPTITRTPTKSSTQTLTPTPKP